MQISCRPSSPRPH